MRPALALCLVLVLAGCQVGYGGDAPARPAATATPADGPLPATPAESPTATPTSTPRDAEAGDPDGKTVDAALPLDPDLVYYRTRSLLNVDAGPPAEVVVRNLSGRGVGRDPRRFFRLLGLAADARANDSDVGVAAFVAGPDRVTVNERILDDPASLESTLAHEFTHVVQFRTNAVGRVRAAGGPTVDGRTASRALIEGAATFAADAYWRQHVTNGTRPAVEARRLHQNLTGGARYAVAPYRFGYRYVAERIDHPSALPRLYGDPPVTTEQLLHPGVTETPGWLSTRVRETDAWLHVPGERRMGELFVRTALDTELGRSRAVRAAAGWGTDARLDFVGRRDRMGYAWLLRFDDAADAAEFAAAFADYRAARGDGAAGTNGGTGADRIGAFRHRRLGGRTVVVFAGAPAFVDGAAARLQNGSVVVRAPYANSSSGTPKTSAMPASATTQPITTSPPE